MKLKLLLLCAATFCGTVFGQSTFNISDNDIIFSSKNGKMRISMCNEQMFRITKINGSKMPTNEPWMVIKYHFDKVKFNVKGNVITTSKLEITVKDNPWLIEVTDNKGQLLYKEVASSVKDTVGNTASMQADEHFFGFGERMDFLDQRGHKLHLNVELGNGTKPAVGGKDILRANYCPVPFFISNKGYSIFFHTAMPTDWDMGWNDINRYSFSAIGGVNDYYFILGPSIEKMLQGYQTLTGKAPLMPRSAYGIHIGSYSGGTWKYEKNTSDTYVVNLVHRLRNEKIPFDLLWLDSTWRLFAKLGNGGCTFEFQDTFKDPRGMIDSIYASHVDMFGLHIRSLIDNGHSNTLLDDARKANVVINDGNSDAIINFFDDKAADWWWKNAASKVTSLGVKFFKTDVGSALRFNKETAEQQSLHNLFPIAYAKAPYERFAKLNNQRGFDHTREGYAGIQRYPFIWAGDWGSEWQWFEPVIRGGLNIGLSGVGYWSHCMGGFEQYSPYDTDLYIRWCQFGMFSPVSMLFGMDHPRYHAPWTYGNEAEHIFIQYDSLRYSLFPYIYSAAFDMYESSRPIMTPLLFDYINDELTYDISNQYMFGRSIMICPVTTKRALSRVVYFPGDTWLDYWTGERINGKQYKSFLTPPDIMPIFIKKGAIIPQQQAMQYMGEKAITEISFTVFPSAKSSYQLYEDDGKTTDYQQGIYSITNVISSINNGVWNMKICKHEGKYTPSAHNYCIKAFLETKPVSLTINGNVIPQASSIDANGWQYDEKIRCLIFKTNLTNNEDINIEVK